MVRLGFAPYCSAEDSSSVSRKCSRGRYQIAVAGFLLSDLFGSLERTGTEVKRQQGKHAVWYAVWIYRLAGGGIA
ncbi:MAG: hypothetical protein IMY85_05840 [Chloroflexi bacterium]|nr:hypothetical protein [Chloroflexota bacterium]